MRAVEFSSVLKRTPSELRENSILKFQDIKTKLSESNQERTKSQASELNRERTERKLYFKNR